MLLKDGVRPRRTVTGAHRCPDTAHNYIDAVGSSLGC